MDLTTLSLIIFMIWNFIGLILLIIVQEERLKDF